MDGPFPSTQKVLMGNNGEFGRCQIKLEVPTSNVGSQEHFTSKKQKYAHVVKIILPHNLQKQSQRTNHSGI